MVNPAPPPARRPDGSANDAPYESLRRCDAAPAKAAIPASTTESTHIAQAMTFPGDGDVPPQSTFGRETPKIVLGMAVRDAKPGDRITATWIAEKTDGTASNFVIASIPVTLGTSQTVAAKLSKPDAGWPAGLYRVDVSHNDGPVEFSQRFTVTP